MNSTQEVKPGDWVRVLINVRAVVSKVYDGPERRIEVVYLDERSRAINEDAVWKDDEWVFAVSGPCGGYADNYDRLSSYVAKLRGNAR